MPRLETNSTSASSVSSGGTPSAAGEALQRLPAMVPRFWICTEPTSRAASFNASQARGSGVSIISRPSGRAADADRRRLAFDSTDVREAREIEHCRRRRLVDERRKDIGPAGQDRVVACGEEVRRLGERGRADEDAHARNSSGSQVDSRAADRLEKPGGFVSMQTVCRGPATASSEVPWSRSNSGSRRLRRRRLAAGARGEASGKPYSLDAQVGFLLRQASQRHTAIFAARMIGDLTTTQWAALARLEERGPCSQNLLGRLTAMDAATIKGVVDRLVGRGYAEATADPNDSRRL